MENSLDNSGLVWYNIWRSKEVTDTIDFIAVLQKTKSLLSIKIRTMIVISFPATTCNVEKSFKYI